MLLRRAAGPLLVFAAYYLGAEIGFALKWPDAPQSVLWLPNAILFAALLLLPGRAWPAYLAGGFPAQMLVAWQTGAPKLAMALLFVTNCGDAVVGTLLVRAVLGHSEPFRFDRLRSTVVFVLLGAALTPVVVSFADAGISTATGWAPSYWTAFFARARSNVLTDLIVVPALVGLLTLEWRAVSAARVREAGLLMLLVVLTSDVAFARSPVSDGFPTVLYAPLPLLFWAAVRFGPGGTGWTVLLVAIVASWNALHGLGPFASRSPAENVVSLQLFLLSISVPLLFLSAVIQERNRTTRSLQENETALRDSYARVRDLAGKLIAGQELERARIGRDMHDDVNQQLAALSISISAVRNGLAAGNEELREALNTLQERTVALTDRVRSISHDLHAGMLEHVGLVPALRTHCVEFGRQRQLSVAFSADENVDPVPRDVAISLYRIAQEALRNVAHHAGASAATVSIVRSPDGLEMTIGDNGRGFEPSAARSRGGVGLMSMEERARLADGSLTIVSSPGHGTTLRVRIPTARFSGSTTPLSLA